MRMERDSFPRIFVERVGSRLKWDRQSATWYGDPHSETGPSLSAWVHDDHSIAGWVEVRLPSVTVIIRWNDEGMIATVPTTWDIEEGLTGEDFMLLHKIDGITEGELKRAVRRGGSDLQYLLVGTVYQSA